MYTIVYIIKALACVEDVPLAEMWSQGVFIDRRHGLAVVVLVLQSWILMVNLPGPDPKLVRKKSSGDPLRLGQHVRVGQHVWSGQLVWRSSVQGVRLGAVCSRGFIRSCPVWMNDTRSEQVFTFCAL